MSTLAVFGGSKVIQQPFGRYNPIGSEEAAAVAEVMCSGVLSQFLGAWHEDFFGGPRVRAFEKAAEAYFGVKHAVTVNSLTSGLMAAVGAIGIEPGDEVIVSPWTMSASATAILNWNAIPVFADIEPDMFCLDPVSIAANITPYTKAIIAVDIFGQSADMHAINTLARQHGLKVISDTAQAPGAQLDGRHAGTMADIGGFSLNYHKHIHTGEGGIMVTDDDAYAERLRLIRNHAEAVVGPKGTTDLSNMIGYNFRLGEIESAIGVEQLKKLSPLIKSRQRAAATLSAGLKDLIGLRVPIVRPGASHVYYIFPLILDTEALGIDRATIKQALEAEGVMGLSAGYQNLHLMPLYQRKIAYGSQGFPWNASFCRREVDYRKGICPVAERLHEVSYMGLALCMFEFGEAEVQLVIEAFHKVWSNLNKLRQEAR